MLLNLSFCLARFKVSFFSLSHTLSLSITSFLSSSLFCHTVLSCSIFVNLSSGFHILANNSFSLFLSLPFLLSPSVLENYYQEFTIGFEVEKLLLQTFSIPLARANSIEKQFCLKTFPSKKKFFLVKAKLLPSYSLSFGQRPMGPSHLGVIQGSYGSWL